MEFSKAFFFGSLVISIIASAVIVGCSQQDIENVVESDRIADLGQGTDDTDTSEQVVDLKTALSLAIEKIEPLISNGKNGFKLTAVTTENGWRFTFFFIPATPGGHVVVRVSDEGNVELSKGL